MQVKAAALFAGLATLFLTASSLQADFIAIAQPTSAYLSGTKVLDFTDTDYTLVGSLSGSGETLSYDNLLDERTVPASWASWGTPPAVEVAAPRVGYTDGMPSLTITLSRAATTFGFEVEPNTAQAEQTTADFYSGTTLVGTLDLSPSGDSGALLFAASTTSDPFTSVVINNLEGDDFGIARQRFRLAGAATPEPGTWGLLGGSLAALAGARQIRRRRG